MGSSLDREAALDCVIIGGGLAGAAAAAVLGRNGYRVALVDPKLDCPPVFKAEKIEPDQVELLQRLGLLDGVAPHAFRINAVREAFNGRVFIVRPIHQYGIAYPDLVNAVRRQIPAAVQMHVARAVHASLSADEQTLTLDDGRTLRARLLVLAAGTGGRVHEALGVARREVRDCHSVACGFDIARADGLPFPYEGITAFCDSPASRIAYVTVFQLPGRMRINVFTHHLPKDPWLRELASAPRTALERRVPGISALIGDWRVASRVEIRPIDLYIAEQPREGLVLLGDAGQSVCPATGTGLSKALTDVEALCERHFPGWMKTPGMGAAKVLAFHRDPKKLACDRHSMQAAEYWRKFSTERSLRWMLVRKKKLARLVLAGWRARAAGRPADRGERPSPPAP